MKLAKDAVILVTGASQGIGFAIAEGFAKAGYRVIGVSRSLPKASYSFKAQTMDVTKVEEIQTLFARIQQRYQRLDVLINNAGFGIAGPLEETPMEEAKRVFDVNVFGMLQVSQHAIPLLKKTKGMIINIGSVASDFSLPFQTIYSMSKASVASFTEGLRNELRPFGIRVVNVKPGDTKSNFSTQRKVFVAPSSPYEKRVHHSVAVMEKDEKNGLPTASVYKVCRRLVNQKNPPIHVTIGLQYQVLQALRWLLPTKLVQWLLYQIYGK